MAILVNKQMIIDNTLNAVDVHIGLNQFHSIAVVGSYFSKKSNTLDSDIDFCLFLKDESKANSIKDDLRKIEGQVNDSEPDESSPVFIQKSPIKLWIHHTLPEFNTPVEILKLDGWSGLCPTYLNLYKYEHGTTIYPLNYQAGKETRAMIKNQGTPRCVEDIDVSREIPNYEGYELFLTSKVELAEGLGTNNQHKIAKSILRAMAAFIISETGYAITNDQHIEAASVDWLEFPSDIRELIQQAYLVKTEQLDAMQIPMTTIIDYFYDIHQSSSYTYGRSIEEYDNQFKVARYELLNDYKTNKSSNIAHSLCDQRLWNNIKLYYLYFEELESFLFGASVRETVIDNKLTRNRQVSDKLVSFISKVSANHYDRLDLSAYLSANTIKLMELSLLASGLSYTRNTIQKGIELREFLIDVLPDVKTGILHNIATDYDTLQEYDKAVEYWEQILKQFDIEKEQLFTFGELESDVAKKVEKMTKSFQTNYAKHPLLALSVTLIKMKNYDNALMLLFLLLFKINNLPSTLRTKTYVRMFELLEFYKIKPNDIFYSQFQQLETVLTEENMGNDNISPKQKIIIEKLLARLVQRLDPQNWK